MRWSTVIVVVVVALTGAGGRVMAQPSQGKPRPAVKAKVAKPFHEPAPATTTTPATPARPAADTEPEPKAACKRKVVGRGLDRHVVCEFTEAVEVKSAAPNPTVMIAPRDGRAVTGRPRSGDRLSGLPHSLGN